MTNKYLDAFKESGNLLCLASIVGLSAALPSPIPLLAGLAAETAYLLYVPDTAWYRLRLARRSDRDSVVRRMRARAQTLPLLRPDLRRRYERLEEVCRQIGARAATEAPWLGEVVSKLDYLLDRFLAFASKEQEFRNYLQSLLIAARGGGMQAGIHADVPSVLPSAMPDAWIPQAIGEVQADYARSLGRLQETMAGEADPNSRAILQKRADVLERRQEYVGKMGRTLTNLSYQLQLVEDTFGLINDEVRAQSPEQMLSEIDDVVTQTDIMTRTLEEIAPLDQMIARAD